MATKTTKQATGQTAESKALDKFAELVISKIEQVSTDWKKPWFTAGSNGMPRNINGREYNGMNTLMLMMHCENMRYTFPVFATFDAIEKMNKKDTPKEQQIHVLKSQKSFPVFITTWKYYNKESKEYITYSSYNELTAEEKKNIERYPRLQVYNVFNVEAQTNMKDARPDLYDKHFGKKQEERDTTDFFVFDEMDKMIADNLWICPIKPTYGDDAYFSISKNEIVIPEKKQFKSGESFYSNLLHEMAHSTGHEDTLNRLKPSAFGSKAYAEEELIAELTAALVSSRYGMDKVIKEDSVPYIKNWLDTLKEEPAFIKTILLEVKKANAVIEKKLDEVRDKTNNAAA